MNTALFAFSVDARENGLAKLKLHETHHQLSLNTPQNQKAQTRWCVIQIQTRGETKQVEYLTR